jgi:hypothetical protein
MSNSIPSSIKYRDMDYVGNLILFPPENVQEPAPFIVTNNAIEEQVSEEISNLNSDVSATVMPSKIMTYFLGINRGINIGYTAAIKDFSEMIKELLSMEIEEKISNIEKNISDIKVDNATSKTHIEHILNDIDKIKTQTNMISELDKKAAVANTKLDGIKDQNGAIYGKLENLDKRFIGENGIDNRLTRIETKIGIKETMKNIYIPVIFSFLASVIGAVLVFWGMALTGHN